MAIFISSDTHGTKDITEDEFTCVWEEIIEL